MDILDTLVTKEIKEIKDSPMLHFPHRWELVMLADGESVKSVYVRDVQLTRLYHVNYADELEVSAGYIHNQVQQLIIPNKDKLRAILRRIPLNVNVMSEEDKKKAIIEIEYKVTLHEANSDTVAGDTPLAVDKGMSGKLDLREIKVQLYSDAIDHLRKKTFGGVLKDIEILETIGYLLLKYSRGAGTGDINNIKGCYIDPTFKPIERENLPIPHNTPVLDIPMMLDDVCGGLHPSQARFYLQKNHWHIYPIYDHDRFEKSDKTLTIIKIPKHRLPNVEKTVRVVGNSVIILVTGETKYTDVSELMHTNLGNGVRFVDADYIMDDFMEVEDNEVLIDIKKKLNELMYEPRQDEINFVTTPVGETTITSDYNRVYSQLALRSGAYLQATWQNSEVELLYPGMPVRYIYQDGEDTLQQFGTLNAVETLDYNTNNTIADARFITMALLTVFLDRETPL